MNLIKFFIALPLVFIGLAFVQKEDKIEIKVRGSQAQVLLRKNEVLDGFLKILSEIGSAGKE